MRKTVLTVLGFIISLFQLLGQNSPSKLSGTIIGTTNFYDYSNNQCYTGSVNANAFDGNIQNTFATCDRTGGWIGLDLGEPYVITQLGYCPRKGQTARMQLGVFEGANNPDFGDAVTLYVIPDKPTENQLTRKVINCSRGFRYVRYVGPNDAKCNLSELEFYGYKGSGDDSKLPQITNLPTINIHTVNAQDIVDKETYIFGIVSIVSNDGTTLFTDSMKIKGRGNASWSFPKKPYKFKLNHKARLLDFPAKEKAWTLINNYGDKTLMRNLIAFDISKGLEMPYTPAGKPVDVVLNGEYKGTYQLCDQVEVGDDRVNVEKLEYNDIELPLLAGGYLIEMDAYANEGTSWFTSARNKVPVTIKYPEDDEIVSAQSNYIKTHFEKMETALAASNYTNTTTGYRKYIDVPSFTRQFLVGEISGNTDTYWSTYMFKRRFEDLFYFAPVWDFDIAFENDSRTYPINNQSDWICFSKGSWANGVRTIVNRIFSDPAFVKELKDTYAYYRNSGAITEDKLLDLIDYYALEIDDSQKLNFTRWNILNSKVHMNPTTYGSYQGEVNNVKNYVKNRIAWMDNKLNYVPTGIANSNVSDTYVLQENNTVRIKGIETNSQIKIFDISGRLMISEHASSDFSTTLPQGIYIIKILTDSNESKTLKCIIQ